MLAALQYVSNMEHDKDPMHKCLGVTEKGLVLLVGPAPWLTHSFPKGIASSPFEVLEYFRRYTKSRYWGSCQVTNGPGMLELNQGLLRRSRFYH